MACAYQHCLEHLPCSCQPGCLSQLPLCCSLLSTISITKLPQSNVQHVKRPVISCLLELYPALQYTLPTETAQVNSL